MPKRRWSLLLALALLAPGAGAITIIPPPPVGVPPGPGPVTLSDVSQTLGAPPATSLEKEMAVAHVSQVFDPQQIFGTLSNGQSGFVFSTSVWNAVLQQTPSETLTQIACQYQPDTSNICDCGCAHGGYYYDGWGNSVATPATPGTSFCPSTSRAMTTPQPQCTDGTYQRSEGNWVFAQAGAQVFSLSFPDGTSIAQQATQPFFYYFTDDAVPHGSNPGSFSSWAHSGFSPANGYLLPEPGGPLACTSPNAGLCTSSLEVLQYSYLSGQNKTIQAVQINAWQGGSTPAASLTLVLDQIWSPGTPDAGGPMVWANTWNQTTFYKANSVVAWQGSTYLALNDNEFAEPDTDHVQWMMIGGGSGSAGPTGPQGPAGPQGSQGPMGLQGPAGNDGAAGAPGSQGPIGPQGPAGNEGAQGPTGAQGAQGPAGLVWIGDWSPSTSYHASDAVFFNGSSYVSTDDNVASQPSPANPDWALLAQNGATGATGAPGKDLLNLPGSIATFAAIKGCPAGSTPLGSTLITYSVTGHPPSTTKSIVYCQF
jgi:hypothetical protein